MEWVIHIEQEKFHSKQISIYEYSYNINFINPRCIHECYIKENLNNVDRILIYQLITDWMAN